jgi:C1A family cysteine protease
MRIFFYRLLRWICWKLEDIHDVFSKDNSNFYPSARWETIVYQSERKYKMEQFTYGAIPSEVKDTDWIVTSLVKDTVDKLPTKVDYTDLMTPVRNQGSEGSCVGFASVVGVKEYQEQIDWHKFISLSPRYVYEYAKKITGSSSGTSLKAAAQVLSGRGVCEEEFWKYLANEPGKPLDGADVNAVQYKVKPNYLRITNEKELKASLVKYGAVLIAVKVYKNWYRDNKTGHIPDSTWSEKFSGVLGGHAIALVGYDDATKEYKFKNSWAYKDGKLWGDKGYGYLSYKEQKFELMEAYLLTDIKTNLPVGKKIMTVADIPFTKLFTAWV